MSTPRTSASQFETLIGYMERNGDLNRCFVGGPWDRINHMGKWQELANDLNLDVTGSSKPVEKWKKVWSDFKNNTKKKNAKINKLKNRKDGAPCKLALTDFEQRVLALMSRPRPYEKCRTSQVLNLEAVGTEMVPQSVIYSVLPVPSSTPPRPHIEDQIESNGDYSDMTKDWTTREDRHLIKFVRLHLALYNVRHEDYLNTDFKQELWCDIASALDTTDHECIKRWCYLRDSYIKQKKEPLDNVDEAFRKRDKLLRFLDKLPSQDNEEDASNDSCQNEEVEEEIIVKIESDSEENDLNNHTLNEDIDNSRNSDQDKLQKNNSSDTIVIDKVECNCQKRKLTSNNPEEMNENHLFFSSMEKIVQKLPRFDQANLRLQISSLVCKAEMRYIMKNNSDPSSTT